MAIRDRNRQYPQMDQAMVVEWGLRTGAALARETEQGLDRVRMATSAVAQRDRRVVAG